MRDVLRGAPEIEIVNTRNGQAPTDYDVLVLNSLEGDSDPSGYARPRPDAGIVMVAGEGRTASVFRRLGDDLCLDDAVPLALKQAIFLAAERS